MKRGKFLRMLFGAFFVGFPLSCGEIGWTVYLRSVGPLKLGMTLAAVKRVLGDGKATLAESPFDSSPGACAFLESNRIPNGITIWLKKGYLVRIDIDSSRYRTAAGVGIGDTEERVREAYKGSIRVEGHHYDPNGHYLKYRPKSKADREYGIVFETDGEKVSTFRIGTLETVIKVEGCE